MVDIWNTEYILCFANFVLDFFLNCYFCNMIVYISHLACDCCDKSTCIKSTVKCGMWLMITNILCCTHPHKQSGGHPGHIHVHVPIYTFCVRVSLYSIVTMTVMRLFMDCHNIIIYACIPIPSMSEYPCAPLYHLQSRDCHTHNLLCVCVLSSVVLLWL